MSNQKIVESIDYMVSLVERLRRSGNSRSAGWSHIIWGATTAAGFLTTQGFIIFGVSNLFAYLFIWAAVVVVAIVLNKLFIRFPADSPGFFLDKAIGKSWRYFSLALWVAPIAIVLEAIFLKNSVLTAVIPIAEMIILSVAAGVTGVLAQSRYLGFVAIVGFVFTIAMTPIPLYFGFFFAVMQVLLLVVPGILILRSVKEG